MNASTETAPGRNPKILIVDDDGIFAGVLARAFDRRGYSTRVAVDLDSALDAAAQWPPDYAVVDLKLPRSSGLHVVKRLREIEPRTRIVMLTGFGSIATTVDAIKLGAVHYLTKPANADEVLAALHRDEPQFADTVRPEEVPSVYRVEWEHIQRVLSETEGNISLSARRLGIHRRTLQRKLGKHPVRR
jgi:two-component system, response regulator RegA